MVHKETIVYFAGAIRGDRVAATAMAEMVKCAKNLGFEVLTEHVAADDPIQTLAARIGKTKQDLTAEDIEQQDIQWLDQATHVIAEISGASTGTGREIEYARIKHQLGKVPAQILCLYQKDREFFASPMIRGMSADRYPNVRVSPYRTIKEACIIITKFLA